MALSDGDTHGGNMTLLIPEGTIVVARHSRPRGLREDRGRASAIFSISRIQVGRCAITTMRSAMITASSMSWVTKRIVLRVFSQIAQDFALHPSPRQGIERRQRFVHQEDLRINRKRAGDFESLSHAAGQVAWVMPGKPIELNELQQLGYGLLAVATVPVGSEPQPISEVLGGGQPWKQRRLLEHHHALAARTGNRFAAEQHSARAGLQIAGEQR